MTYVTRNIKEYMVRDAYLAVRELRVRMSKTEEKEINDLAQEGWRIISIQPYVDYTFMVFFERDIQVEDHYEDLDSWMSRSDED